MRKLISISVVLIVITFLSCSEKAKWEECTSFIGKPLYLKEADSTALFKSDSAVIAIMKKGDLSEDDYVEIGRQLSSVFKYRFAVENFSEGLKKFPNSFKLLRYRGHRYINLRQVDKAMADLTRAEELIRPQSEVWEYDAKGNKVATYQHQIWYHIGICHFLNKSYAECAKAFEKSLIPKQEGKNLAGASDWLYNAYQRSGQKEKLDSVLAPFTADFAIDDKDYPYYRRLLLYKGIITPAELIDSTKPIGLMTLNEVTKLYGLANWLAYSGNKPEADQLYLIIVQSKEWPAFAVACAEKELTVH